MDYDPPVPDWLVPGFQIGSCSEALEVILAAIGNAGYKPGEQIAIALDVAAFGELEEQRR